MTDEPDFYIVGREGPALRGLRSCWKLNVVNADGRNFLLVRISPDLSEDNASRSDVVGLSQRVVRPFEELLEGRNTVVVVWAVKGASNQGHEINGSIGTASLFRQRPELDAEGHVVPTPPIDVRTQFRS